MEKQFMIETAAEPQNLKVIREFFHETAAGNLAQEDIYYMEVCINEMCENIIRHGYEEHERETIHIKINFDDGYVRVTIVDRGKPFNVLEYEPIAMETLIKKGIKGKLGIRTIKTICDKIYYKRLKGKNQLVLVKKRRGYIPAEEPVKA
jgi:anti-sigma regulatory factor (Ser/Thr protein kinase)